jgi:hypothetical protein
VAQARQYSAVKPALEKNMFKKILIANRGDQPRSGAAAELNCLVRVAHAGDFNSMEITHV